MEPKTLLDCICQICEKFWDKPVSLPCGCSICQDHIVVNTSTFKCESCGIIHEIPATGFAQSKSLTNFLDKNVHLNGKHLEAKNKLEMLKKSLSQYELSVQATGNQDEYVKNYFGNIKNQCIAHREKIVQEIDQEMEKNIQNITHLENMCLLNSTHIEKVNFKELKENLIPDMNEFLRKPDINANQLEQTLVKLNFEMIEFEKKIESYNRSCFLNKKVTFEASNIKPAQLYGSLFIREFKTFQLSDDCGKCLHTFKGHSNSVRSVLGILIYF
jgi:hypothetical protein